MSISDFFSKHTRSTKATLAAIIASLLTATAVGPALANRTKPSAKPAITCPGKLYDPFISQSKYHLSLDESFLSLDNPIGEKKTYAFSFSWGNDGKSEEKATEESKESTTLDRFVDSFLYLYTDKSILLKIGTAFGIAGIMANTNIDQELQDKYQDDIRSKGTDDYSSFFKRFGEWEDTLLAYLVAYGGGRFLCNGVVKEWGERAAIATLIGAPGLLGTKLLVGASRPIEERGSDWNLFFNDSDGASGHAFVGAIPFLTAAKMTDNIFAKTAFYIASPLCALSRVNDNSHYTSQAFLGYTWAWLSVNSVDRHMPKIGGFEIAPVVDREYFGLLLTKSF